jgi:hypothetical protein
MRSLPKWVLCGTEHLRRMKAPAFINPQLSMVVPRHAL